MSSCLTENKKKKTKQPPKNHGSCSRVAYKHGETRTQMTKIGQTVINTVNQGLNKAVCIYLGMDGKGKSVLEKKND